MNAILRVRVGYNPDGTPIFKSIPAIKGEKGDKGDPGGESLNQLNYGDTYEHVDESVNVFKYVIIKDYATYYGLSEKKADGTYVFATQVTNDDDTISRVLICTVNTNSIWQSYIYDFPQYTEGDNIEIVDNRISVKTTDEMTEGDSRPITSNGVYVVVGNINTLLERI
ncbi:MAG: hypothetical protein KBT35_01230 [Firmicutes bacterium]|nr:hypothetical protein [Candidatus Colivicinus equi]